MPQHLLAAAIIVRNEADHLRRCLSSIRALCDDIIVVDTGSSDDTVAVAEAFGARVFHKEWRHDFAASRNRALDEVDAEWVLYIDADEEVVDTDVEAVRSRLEMSSEVAAFGIAMTAQHGWTPYTDFRIWRHRPDIRFRGEIHESSIDDIIRVAEENGQRLTTIDISILHHGYSGDPTAKNIRNLPLLEAELSRNPDNSNLWNHLGRVYRELGDLERAERTWREGIRRVREQGLRSPIDVHLFASLSDFLMARGDDPLDLIREAREFGTDFWTLNWLEAKYLMGEHRYAEAEPLLRELIDEGRRGIGSTGYSYNRDMFDQWPKAALADAVFGMCRFDEAIGALAEAGLAGYEEESIILRTATCNHALDYRASPLLPRPAPRTLLPDVTFVIAVRIDSNDRLQNLQRVVGRLLADFDVRILIGCEEPESLRTLMPTGVEVIGVSGNPNHPFHLTRVINETSALVATPVRVHIEADIVLPPEQIIEGVRLIRSGESDLVLPFTFGVGVPAASQVDFMNGPPSISTGFRLRPMVGQPYGGCQIWKSTSFVESGMDNEFLIGWGPEDQERLQRVRILGMKLTHVPGPMFHLDHEANPLRGAQSDYRSMGDEEFNRIQVMSTDELRREVTTWPWLERKVFSPPKPIDADDLTATIPIRVDTTDRLRNLVSSTNSLANGTTARILVGAGDPSMLYTLREEGILHPRVEIVVVDDPSDGPFHRTRILNDLARVAKTPYIANLDTDIIVPIAQWSASLDLLRSGEAEFVLPYDGRMVEVSYAHHPWLERADYDSLPRVGRRMMHPNSVGGCVIWNREAFTRVGMENENLVSWGYDDNERVTRASKLGVQARRVPGVVYHLLHRRGADSRHDHPLILTNRAVMEGVRRSTPEKLAQEISTWRWTHETREYTVLVWSDTWHEDGDLFPTDLSGLRVSHDRAELPVADVVIFPLPTLDIADLPVKRAHAEQKWILFTRESAAHFPHLMEGEFRAKFDLVSSYEMDSDLPMPYAKPGSLSNLGPVVPWSQRMKTPLCAWVSGPWDRSGRRDLLMELLLNIQMDSYGLVLNNMGDERITSHQLRRDVTSRYRFVVAAENSICPDYVTEKVYEALKVGSVPVYHGAPNISSFLPAEKCAINVADFGSVGELADYLTNMSESEYMTFHSWRHEPLRSEFIDLCSSHNSLGRWIRDQVDEVR